MELYLYYPNKKKVKKVDSDMALYDMYYKLAILPTPKQLAKPASYFQELKSIISQLDNYVPLFDLRTKNIYLIQRNNVYDRVIYSHYRPITKNILHLIESTYKEINKEKSSKFASFKERLKKNIDFISNFDLDKLQNTFHQVFFNTNPSSTEITTCFRPSFLPNQMYQNPYYSKSELVNFGLNNGTLKDENKRPLDYTAKELSHICKIVKENDIDSRTLLQHKVYIQGNGAIFYVQYYTFFGSFFFNSYLRGQDEVRDLLLENHIKSFWKLVLKAPALQTSYIVYRFIETDDHYANLQPGDTYKESSFISTTRNPFYDHKKNVFGFVLVKIRLPAGVPGVALCIEPYSHFQHEQEVLLPPGELKLVNINDDFKYFHFNVQAERSIIRKYEFDYVKPLADIDKAITALKYPSRKTEVPTIDFMKVNLGDTKIKTFMETLPKVNNKRMFKTKIGSQLVEFECYYLIENPIYQQFFFLQQKTNMTERYGDEIYFIHRDKDSAMPSLVVEIRNVISIDYYNRFCPYPSTYSDMDLLDLCGKLGFAFEISDAFIHGRYQSYQENTERAMEVYADVEMDDQKLDSSWVQMLSMDSMTYCVDVIDYLKHKKKRFTNNAAVQPVIRYHTLDKLQSIDPFDVLNMKETYQLFKVLEHWSKDTKKKPNAAELYIHMHDNYPYLISLYQQKLNMKPHPWHMAYRINCIAYMQETYGIGYDASVDTTNFDEFMSKMTLETSRIFGNRYRWNVDGPRDAHATRRSKDKNVSEPKSEGANHPIQSIIVD